ncbi:MAG: glucosamine-6-phosphate deaminase [Rhodobacteraceae bacterium]|nr:glucosamine-6-phosphate deaminase [Paracoccaceae bacterium]
MKILIFNSSSRAVERAASAIADRLEANPRIVLGLATGGTMLDLYRDLVAQTAGRKLSFAQATSFNLDEYVGLAPDHPASYHSYMRECLFSKVDFSAENTHLPRGDATDLEAEARDYEARIAKAGGIDLQLLGIGQNGHIGFNEPSSSLASRTRIKTRTASTHSANACYFASPDQMPKYALTMGVGTILDSRECLLLATGPAKAAAVAAMVEGPVSASCPASVLQFHQHATVILDRAAATDLKLLDYYHYVHPEDDVRA